MYASKITPLTGAAVALVAVLTLGACGKKIDDARTSGPSSKPPVSSMGGTESSGTSTGAMGTPTGVAGMPLPTVPASGATN